MFKEFYWRKISRRLLFDKSANHDNETLMLTKLKQQHGSSFTTRMEAMIKDMKLDREHKNNFQEYLSDNPEASPGIDFPVTLLTSRCWPSYKSADLSLPVEMVKCVKVFNDYLKEGEKRCAWIYSLGTCHINANFEHKSIELIVGTYQGAALLLFNESARLSYKEIMAQLNLSEDDANRILQSLSCEKYKILNKEPSTNTISPTDVFEFNSKFRHKKTRVMIPLPREQEKKKEIFDVKFKIDYIKIMKSRKILIFQQLVKECIEDLRRKDTTQPDVSLIKKAIEELISLEYLERDKDNQNLFKYLP